MDKLDFVSRLIDKNAVAAHAFADQIVRESRGSDCWYPYFDETIPLLNHKNSLVRNRAIEIITANARWDMAGKLDYVMGEFLDHVTDEKPITARSAFRRCRKSRRRSQT